MGKSQAVQELEEELGREKEQWETMRMCIELEGLRQLEDVRQQLEQQASVIEKVK